MISYLLIDCIEQFEFEKEGERVMAGNNTYDAGSIAVLEGLEAVRKRPGMYIGSVSTKGLNHLIYEIVDNAVDEHLAGFCSEIQVTLEKDGSATVSDNGRGVPVDMHQKGVSAARLVYTTLHAGGKFDDSAYKTSGGLHGVGSSVVNALSTYMDVKISRDGFVHHDRYERGIPVIELEDGLLPKIGKTRKTGTTVNFLPDDTIFEKTKFKAEEVKSRLHETAYLNPNLTIVFDDKREGSVEHIVYHEPEGIIGFIQDLNRKKEVLHDPVYFKGEADGIEVEVTLQYVNEFHENVLGFCNNIYNAEGGTHLTGFKSAITKVFNDYARKNNIIKEKDDNLSGDDLREGLAAIVSIKISDPQFEGQTKQKLGNSEARPAVESVVTEQLTYYLEQNPQIAKIIVNKAAVAQRARIAARKARDVARKANLSDNMALPGKLADCSDKDPKNCEIYIVEGDSAGGSAKTARSRATQAILPLRGKILNVEKARIDRILGNEEIKAMITAFGTGIHENFNIEKLRYNKIIIMTDADVDGAHIATLLLTFFYRFMPDLIRKGHVYLAQPPLYKLEKNKKVWYAYSDDELNSILDEVGRDQNNKIQRYKGLGEMDAEQLWETTMDPEKRILLRVAIDDDDESEIDMTFNVLMGDKVEPRREFIETNAKYVKNLDI